MRNFEGLPPDNFYKSSEQNTGWKTEESEFAAR